MITTGEAFGGGVGGVSRRSTLSSASGSSPSTLCTGGVIGDAFLAAAAAMARALSRVVARDEPGKDIVLALQKLMFPTPCGSIVMSEIVRWTWECRGATLGFR